MNASAVIFLCLLVVGGFAQQQQQPPQPQPPRQPEQPTPQPQPQPPQPQPRPEQPQPQPQPQPQQPSDSQGKQSIKEFTEKLIQSLQNMDREAIMKCMTNRTRILVSSKLPFGGKFTGPEGFKTMMSRCDQFIDNKKHEVNLLWADERTGLSMLNSVVTGTLKPQQASQPIRDQPRNQQPPQPQPQPQPQPSDKGDVQLRAQFGIDWFANGKISKFVITPLNDMEVFEKSRTKSQLVLDQILPVVMHKDKEFDINQLKQFVADDITLKLYNFGSSQLVPKTEFKGLNEIHEAVKICLQRKEHKSKCAETDLENFCSGTFRVLHADDTSLVLLFVEGRSFYIPNYQVLTFTLNQQGKLGKVEIVRSKPLYPWQVNVGAGSSGDVKKPNATQPH